VRSFSAEAHPGPAADHGLDHLGADDGAARADLAQRIQQPAQVADAVLRQVGQAGRAVTEQLERVALVGVLGQHHDTGLRVRRPDRVRRVDALHGGLSAGLGLPVGPGGRHADRMPPLWE
jgi:hypothetical protein